MRETVALSSTRSGRPRPRHPSCHHRRALTEMSGRVRNMIKPWEATYKFLYRANYGIRKEGRIRSVTFHPRYSRSHTCPRTCMYMNERTRTCGEPRVTCMGRERPYLIKQRVLTRQPHTFPPASNAFFHLVRTFPRYQRDLALSAFTLNLTIRAPSVRSTFTFARFRNGLKENRGFPTPYDHLRNLLNPTFYRKGSR